MILIPLQFRSKYLCAVVAIAAFALVCRPLHAQEPPPPNCGGAAPTPAKPFVSENATASATVAGGTIDIHYNTPHMHGRKIMGCLVPDRKSTRLNSSHLGISY